jgi:LytTr DNA-binding domain
MLAMHSRARFAWRGNTGCSGECPSLCRLAAASTRAPGRIPPLDPARPGKQPARRRPAPVKKPPQTKTNELLEGFCPEPSQEEQIAVNANGLMLFLRLADIEWLEAADNGVKLRVGKQTHRLRDTLAALAAKLPPGRFLRISRSTLVNIEHVAGVQRMFFDEYEVLLRNGARLTPTRAYYESLSQIGLPLPASIPSISGSRLTLESPASNR